MKRLLLTGMCVMLMGVVALADTPWKVQRVAKQDEAASVLRVSLDVLGTAPLDWSSFKVVNEKGEVIASLDGGGWNKKDSFVEFKGDWSDMIGRYLENGDWRAPLFQAGNTSETALPVYVPETPVPPVYIPDFIPEVRSTPIAYTRVPTDLPYAVHRWVDDHGHNHYGVVGHDCGCNCTNCVAAHTHHGGAGEHPDGGGGHGGGTSHAADCGCSECGGGDHGGSKGYAGEGTGPGAGGDACPCGGSGCELCGKGGNPWAIDPLGKALGQGSTLAMGDAPGNGPGPGSGPGSGDGDGDDCGCEDGAKEGPSPAEAEDCGCEDGCGPGGPGNPGPGNPGTNNFTNMKNMAPQFKQRVRNLAPRLPNPPTYYGPDILVYNPEIPYWNPEIPYYQPGYGYNGGGSGGPGGYGYDTIPVGVLDVVAPPRGDIMPGMVLYVSTGDDKSSGKVYQVDEQGTVLGMVNLPSTATGLAIHRDHGLIATTPRDGGKLYSVNDGGIVETVLEDDAKVLHPVDVAVGANSDTFVVADNMAGAILMTNSAGRPADIYKKLDGTKFQTPNMSVAVDGEKAIIMGTDGVNRGIYRFTADADSQSSTPILPEAGAVAADPASLLWAATQGNNQVVVMEGDRKVAVYTLPTGKVFHNGGMLSFAPPASVAGTEGTGIVVAMRDGQNGNVSLVEYKTINGKMAAQILFDWNKDPMVDFVVGPRMLWEQNHRDTYKGVH